MLMPLQTLVCCPRQNKRTPHAAILDDSNRDILVCIECGLTYVDVHGDEDDDPLAGYPRINWLSIPGQYEVCYVFKKEDVPQQETQGFSQG